MLLLIAVAVWGTGVGITLAAPDVTISAPSTVNLGEPFLVTVDMVYSGSYTPGEGFLDISFPNNPDVGIFDYHSFWDNVNLYPKNWKIWSKTGEISASYPLISAYDSGGWPKTTSISVTAMVTPKNADTLYIYYRGTVDHNNDGNHDEYGGIAPYLSGYHDQQGWPVYRKKITVNSPPSVSLVSPANGYDTTDTTPTFDWSSSDGDGDTLTNTLYIDTGSTPFSGPYRTVNVGTSTVYTLSSSEALPAGVAYSWGVEVSDGKTTVRSSPRSFNVIQPTGNLGIYVKNDARSFQSGAIVKRYDASWNYLDQKTTSSSGYVLWSGISTGTYKYEVKSGGEFWGGGEETVNIDSTTTKYFQKHTPYVDSISIKNINGIIKSTFNKGEKVKVEVVIKNPGSVTYNSKTKLRIDQSRTSPYDFESTSVYQSVNSGRLKTYLFEYTPTSTGTYYIQPFALTDFDNDYIITDDAGWGWSFNVLNNYGSITATVKYPTGSVRTYGSVKLYDGNNRFIKEQSLNSNGQATFSDLNAGTYKLKAYEYGILMGNEKVVSVIGGEPTPVDITTNYEGFLRINVKKSDGSSPLEGATVSVSSPTVSGLKTGITDGSGLVKFGTSDKTFLWPSTQVGESYSIKVIYGGTEVGSETQVNVVAKTTTYSNIDTSVTPPPGSITATVKYPTGSLIKSGYVELYDNNDKFIRKVEVNSNGQATFSDLDAGTYKLKAYEYGILMGNKKVVSVISGKPTLVDYETNYEGFLQIKVKKSDKTSPLEGATVFVSSPTVSGLRDGITDGSGLVKFGTSDKAYLWPSTQAGESYSIKVIYGGTEVGSETQVNVVAKTTTYSNIDTSVTPPPGSITATVKYPTGSLIKSGYIKLYDSNNDFIKKVDVNSNGQATFLDLDAGTYSLLAYEYGILIGNKLGVSVISGQPTPVDITTNYAGTLKVKVLYSDEVIPIQNAEVIIKNHLDNEIKKDPTGSDGIAPPTPTSEEGFWLWPASQPNEAYYAVVIYDGTEIYNGKTKGEYIDIKADLNGEANSKTIVTNKVEEIIAIEDYVITPLGASMPIPSEDTITAGINDELRVWYSINNTYTSNKDVKLITKIRNQNTGQIIPNSNNFDNTEYLTLFSMKSQWKQGKFVIPEGITAGTYDVLYSIQSADGSERYQETWKIGWLIVDTKSYTVSLESSTEGGSIKVDTATYNLPSQVTKQYRMNTHYDVEATPPDGHIFDTWVTDRGVSVYDFTSGYVRGYGRISVTGDGMLRAIFKKTPIFEISEPSPISLNPGETGSTTVTVKSLNGFSDVVELNIGWGEASSNWFSNINWNPKIVTLAPDGEATSELTFDISSSATPGVYEIFITGEDSQNVVQRENLQLLIGGSSQYPILEKWEITPTSTRVGNDIELNYYIYNPNSEISQVTLGATMRDSTGQLMLDGSNDIDIPVKPGRDWYKRSFRIDPDATPGYYDTLLEIHKAHLGEKYGDSGWIENSFEIKTIDSTLADLLAAEQRVYEKRIQYVDDNTRDMVCSYVYFNQNFDYTLLENTVNNQIVSTILNTIGGKFIDSYIVGNAGIIYEEWKNRENRQVFNLCSEDDLLYSTTLDKLSSNGDDNNYIVKDLEKKEQIETTHAEFVKFINEYPVESKNEAQLEQVIQEQIEIFNSNQEDWFRYRHQITLLRNDLLAQDIEADNDMITYKFVSLGLTSSGCLFAIGASGVTMGAAVPLLAVCGTSAAIASSLGADSIDMGVYDRMLMFMLDEFKVYHELLDKISNDYISLISSSKSAIDNLKLLPNGKLISIDASDMKVGETNSMTLKFSNLGTEGLQAIGYFNIYNNSEYFTTLKSSPLTINGGATEDISVSFIPPFDGNYKIDGYVTYNYKKTDTLSKHIVVSPVYGSIVVNTNNETAKFLISDTYSFLGTGTSWTTSEAPIGTYKIVFESIDGYDTPQPQELELTPSGTITFNGEYIKQTITHSVTLQSNKPDVPLIADGKVIPSDQLPKTFTWSENSEHTIYAQSEVHKDASNKYAFIKWNDGNTESKRTIVSNSDQTYSAEYKTQYHLTLKTNPENIGTVFGAGWYDVNSLVQLKAPTINGFEFTEWSVDGTSINGNPTTITMDNAHNVIVNYAVTDPEHPTVIDKTPTGSNVPINTKVTVTFNELMNEESVKSAFSISPSTVGDFSWNSNTLSFTPNYYFDHGTTYMVTLGTGARDLAGNSLQLPYSWQFTTESQNGEFNNAPIANDQSVVAFEEMSIDIVLSATDKDDDSLTYTIFNYPVHGKVTLSGKAATYTPTSNYNGADSFTFKANDGTIDSNVATISITVNPVNDAPKLEKIADTIVTETESVSIQLVASDVDGDALTFSSSIRIPATATLNKATNTVTWVTDYDTVKYSDSKTFSGYITVTDSGGLSDTQPVKVIVKNKNRAPILAKIDNIILSEGGYFTITPEVFEPDNDPYNIQYKIIPSGLDGGNGLWHATKAGEYTLNVNVIDSNGLSADQDVTINVKGTPPRLFVVSPLNNTIINEKNITVSGLISDNDLVNVTLNLNLNGIDNDLTSNMKSGWFEKEIELSDGKNTLVFQASDGTLSSQPVIKVISLNKAIENKPPELTIIKPAKQNIEFSSLNDKFTIYGKVSDDSGMPPKINVSIGSINNYIGISNDGYFSSTVMLINGNNDIIVTATDAINNNLKNTSKISVKYNQIIPEDTQKPVLIITYPPKELDVSTDTLLVTGYAKDETGINSITVNGKNIIHSNGAFSTEITITEGDNEIFINATDSSVNNNLITKKRIVNYNIPDDKSGIIKVEKISLAVSNNVLIANSNNVTDITAMATDLKGRPANNSENVTFITITNNGKNRTEVPVTNGKATITVNATEDPQTIIVIAGNDSVDILETVQIVVRPEIKIKNNMKGATLISGDKRDDNGEYSLLEGGILNIKAYSNLTSELINNSYNNGDKTTLSVGIGSGALLLISLEKPMLTDSNNLTGKVRSLVLNNNPITTDFTNFNNSVGQVIFDIDVNLSGNTIPDTLEFELSGHNSIEDAISSIGGDDANYANTTTIIENIVDKLKNDLKKNADKSHVNEGVVAVIHGKLNGASNDNISEVLITFTLNATWYNTTAGGKKENLKVFEINETSGEITVLDVNEAKFNSEGDQVTIKAKSNGFSSFALMTTNNVPDNTDSSSTSPSSGGGGGGGGGGGASGEAYENIENFEKYEKEIYNDITTNYHFKNNGLVNDINITGNVNAGLINVKVEVLRNTSTLVNESAPGNVYKNLNLWVGSGGFAVPKNIKEATIKFSVDKNWLDKNGIREIVMYRHTDDEWIQLTTKRIGKENGSIMYYAITNRFSPYAISGFRDKTDKVTPQPISEEIEPTITQTVTGNEEQNELGAVGIIAGVLGFALPESDDQTFGSMLLTGGLFIIVVCLWLLKRRIE